MRATIPVLLLLSMLLVPRSARAVCGAELLFSVGGPGSGPGQLREPSGVAVDAGGSVYVADTGNSRIQKFSAMGSPLASWGTAGSGPGQFFSLFGVAVGLDGTIYATDGNRVQHFEAGGAYLGGWGSVGNAPGQFNGPRGIAAGPDGSIYVVDTGNSRVQKFSATGVFQLAWGEYGTDPGQMRQPIGVAVDPAGHVFVTDTYNSRVQRFSESGALELAWGSYGSGPGQFTGLFNITADAAGVFVTDLGHRVVDRFSSSGVYRFKFDRAFQALAGRGIAVGPGANIWVTNSSAQDLEKYQFLGDDCGVTPPPPEETPGAGRILLHARIAGAPGTCAPGIADCAGAVTRQGLSSSTGPWYFVFLLARDLANWPIRGIQCGITYDHGRPADMEDGAGLDVFSWTRCSTLEFPSGGWPAPGSGNALTWASTACQGALAVAGYFYLAAYSTAELRVVARPVDGVAKLADCQGAEQLVTAPHLGSVAFSQGAALAGCNPCFVDCQQVVAVERTTWGGLKARFAATGSDPR